MYTWIIYILYIYIIYLLNYLFNFKYIPISLLAQVLALVLPAWLQQGTGPLHPATVALRSAAPGVFHHGRFQGCKARPPKGIYRLTRVYGGYTVDGCCWLWFMDVVDYGLLMFMDVYRGYTVDGICNIGDGLLYYSWVYRSVTIIPNSHVTNTKHITWSVWKNMI